MFGLLVLNVTRSTKIIALVTDCLEQPRPFSTYEQVLKSQMPRVCQVETRGDLQPSIPEVGVMVVMAGGILVIVVLVVRVETEGDGAELPWERGAFSCYPRIC